MARRAARRNYITATIEGPTSSVLPAGHGAIVARLHSTARDGDAYQGGRRYIVDQTSCSARFLEGDL